MSPRALSIAFQTDKPLAAYGSLASTAEEYGFDGVSIYNDMLYQPAWLPLLEVARATKRVRVGPAAVNPYTCHPINIAGNLALIDEVAQGRAYLGLARGAWLDFVGKHPKYGVTALREALGAVRHLLQQSVEPFEAKVFPLAGGDTLRWEIQRANIPFLLGSWGVKTIQACADLVDEIKLGGTANPDVVPHYRRLLQEAVADGSERHEIGIVVGAVSVVDEDGAAARQLARREVALYLPIVASLDPSVEVEPELLSRMRMAADVYDYAGAADLISDDLLARFAFAGTPDEVAGQAIDVFAAGASRVEFGTPHGLTPDSGLQLLGKRVLPAIRQALND